MPHPGDWTCPNCGDNVFGSRNSCRKCGAGKPASGSAPPHAISATAYGDWTCPYCSDVVFGSRTSCRKCGTARPAMGSASGGAVPPVAASSARSDWTCPACGDIVFASRDVCRKCNRARPGVPFVVGSAAAHAGPAQVPGDWTCQTCGDVVFRGRDACRKCGTAKSNTGSAAPAAQQDWTCPVCSDHVFGSRDECRKCGASRPSTTVQSAQGPAAGSGLRPGDWRCPKCSDVQFARNEHCRQCGEARPQWLGSQMGLAPPQYWAAASSATPWAVLPASDGEVDALRIGMALGGTLGGRDQRAGGGHNNLEVYSAWRLQHPGLWGKYAMERENMRSIEVKSLTSSAIDVPRISARRAYISMMDKLPADLDSEINELYLSHGSSPESVVAILSGGLNERFSGGLFGNGTYLAEDVAKNDQYCTYDESHAAHPELHKLLFDDLGVTYAPKLLYVFFCRVLLGCRIRTKDGNTDLDDSGGRSIWSSRQRELNVVKGSSPPVIHHSLLAETGDRIARFREFIIFHGDRIYPEYLVAFQRT